jgi:hypothetical protein
MATHFLAGYSRKRMALVLLFPVAIMSLALALVVGLRELSLPFETQLDELRLLNPSAVGKAENTGAQSIFSLPENELARYAACRDNGNSNCSTLIRSILEQRPADGRLWLEYARSVTTENGLDSEAIHALHRSFELAPREGWLREQRARFTLSIWPGLSTELREKAGDEIIRGMANPFFADFLAEFYVDRFLARKTITTLLEKAPVADQRRVLSLITTKTKI